MHIQADKLSRYADQAALQLGRRTTLMLYPHIVFIEDYGPTANLTMLALLALGVRVHSTRGLWL